GRVNEYIIKRGGVELTVKLSEETAKRVGATPVDGTKPASSKGRKPQNKSKTPQDKWIQEGNMADFGAADLVAAATQAIRDYCGWHVAPVEEETLALDGTGTDTLLLPSRLVVDVT